MTTLKDRMVEIRLRDLDALLALAQLIDDVDDVEREAIKRAQLIVFKGTK